MQIYSEPSARMPDPNPQRHILVVEDDAFVRDVVEIYLREEGYRVTTATNGQEMRNVLAGDPADLVLMDLRLPGEDGFMLTRYLREHHDCGIIILTTRTETADRVAGLECGADDYVVKPFAERELLARIRSVMRRAPTHRPVPRAQTARDESAVSFHGYVLSAAAGKMTSPEGADIPLTPNEARMLDHLARSVGAVLSREDLTAAVLRRPWDPFDRSIDVLVTRLRQKIELDPKRPTIIRTMRGAGYMLTPEQS